MCASRRSRSTARPTPRRRRHHRPDRLRRMFLFSTDYPHWQFDGDDAIPPHLPASIVKRMCADNPLETFPRLISPHDHSKEDRMNVIDRPARTGSAGAKAGCGSSTATSIRACIRAPTSTVPAETVAGASEDLRRSSAHALIGHALSALLAAVRAPRRLAADRRTAGSDLDFMRQQHLDPLDVEFGILQVLDLFIFSQQNLEFGAAIQRAVNEWQLEFGAREPRLKASILVGQDDTAPPSPRSSAARRPAAMCRSMSAARQRAARPATLLADL